ncbi:uncharacterized protein FOMMEDRAFT_170185 [Fomitiporia mediterranea MF3/22]|uniref:uncharacterized protein n=1 Tax=Fomitiporia mediterranea (strain MF3/22) TaxID=694068 RepID=UPI00044091AF|nr:uncharacterized protein FOMMEDRAFT_170185 [Fomitiporia mediterranea MF3/22]EJD00193.1 hypothetical protein FOMMEDRAFT_170185 [Fomitiporia mediterranea MF3/22]
MVFDFTIFFLTLVRALRTAKYERTPLLRILIVDGFIYYCVMLVISILALTFSIALAPRREILLVMIPPIFKACYCILGSRIALRLRQSVAQEVIGTWKNVTPHESRDREDVELSTLNVASRSQGSEALSSGATYAFDGGAVNMP